MARQPVLCFDGDKAGRKAAGAGRRDGDAASGAGQDAGLRAAARGPGPRRSDPHGRVRQPSRRRSPAALPLVDLVWRPGDGGPAAGHPGAPRRARARDGRDGGDDQGRGVASALPGRVRREAAGAVRHPGAAGAPLPAARRPAATATRRGRPFRPGQPPERVGYLSAPALASASLVQSLKPNAGAAAARGAHPAHPVDTPRADRGSRRGCRRAGFRRLRRQRSGARRLARPHPRSRPRSCP